MSLLFALVVAGAYAGGPVTKGPAAAGNGAAKIVPGVQRAAPASGAGATLGQPIDLPRFAALGPAGASKQASTFRGNTWLTLWLNENGDVAYSANGRMIYWRKISPSPAVELMRQVRQEKAQLRLVRATIADPLRVPAPSAGCADYVPSDEQFNVTTALWLPELPPNGQAYLEQVVAGCGREHYRHESGAAEALRAILDRLFLEAKAAAGVQFPIEVPTVGR